MKNTIKFIAVCALLTGANGSFAGGNHGGGHGPRPEGDSIGKPGDEDEVSRTISVDMADAMRFTPNDLLVKQGQTIRFVVKNSGKLRHEFFLGTTKALKDRYEAMKKNPAMENVKDNQVTVEPGQTGVVIWRFTEAGTVHFACLHPGHFDAGMKGNIKVASAK